MPKRQQKGRILFVDDDKSGRELSRYNLEERGYAVDLAGDDAKALELLSANRHDLVVTDLRMPRVSGMELLRRTKEQGPDVPAVVITAHGNVETAAEAMRAGAYDFIEKPFSRDVLLHAVGLRVPPLRDRAEDIEVPARHFVARASRDRDLTIPKEVMDELKGRPWPGNVRELENACERLVILCEGDELRHQDLPPAAGAGAPVAGRDEPWPALPPEGPSLVDLERDVIDRALKLNGWNVARTAVYLKIPRHVRSYRIEKYGLRRSRSRATPGAVPSNQKKVGRRTRGCSGSHLCHRGLHVGRGADRGLAPLPG